MAIIFQHPSTFERPALSMSSEETTDVKARSAIQALGELFSDPKLRSHSYHRYVLVRPRQVKEWDRTRRNGVARSAATRPDAPDTPCRVSVCLMYSTPSNWTSVPDHLPNSTRWPTLTSIEMSLPPSSRPPGPTAMTSPSWGFSFAVSGMMMPPLVFSSASDPLDDDAIVKRAEFHGFASSPA
jgi:hypothetical protein